MKINYVGKRLLALTLSTAMVMNCGISVFAAETQSETEIVISIPEPESPNLLPPLQKIPSFTVSFPGEERSMKAGEPANRRDRRPLMD